MPIPCRTLRYPRAIAVGFVSLGIFALSCSLRPVQPLTIGFSNAASLRDNPELNAMSYFALAVSGGVSNTVAASNVGNRSLDCLNLVGQVSFPYSLNELLSGVQISLAQGNHRFTVLAFANASGSTPTTIAQLYSQSPALKAYVVAQAEVNTAAATAVTLSSTYAPSSATDLMVACPAPTNAIFGMYRNLYALMYLTYGQGSWAKSLIGYSDGQDGMYVDAEPVTHFSFFDYYANTGIHYQNNAGGPFVDEPAVDTASAAPSDVTAASDGKINLLAVSAISTPHARLFERLGSNSWVDRGDLLNSGAAAFTSLLLRSGPDTTMLAGAWHEVGVNVIHLRTRNSSGGWSIETTINSAGVTTCVAGGTLLRGLIDSNGVSHIAFACHLGPVGRRLGYATNRTGTWLTTDLMGSDVDPLTDIAIDIDSQGLLHIYYVSETTKIKRITGSSTATQWQASELIFDSLQEVGTIAAAVVSPTVQHLLFTYFLSGTYYLKPLSNESGTWAAGPEIDNSITRLVLKTTLFAR